MAVVTIETMSDEEASMIKDMTENLDFSVTVKVEYEDEIINSIVNRND